MGSEKMSRRQALYIALSILVAAAIWLFVDQTSGPNGGARTRPREITDIPIEYINESSLTDRGLMLVDEDTDHSIDLTLEGTRWLIARLDRSDIRVTVDLSNVESAGEQNIGYKINYTDRRFANNALIQKDASIYTASVNVRELYSRNVEVRCELSGNVAEGFSAGQVQLSHTSIEIQGQADSIDPVSYAKVAFDIGENAEETVSQSLELRFYDKDDQELDATGIRPETKSIDATLPVFVVKELRLKMNFVESPGARNANVDYEIKPATITVSGDAGKLKDVDSITLDEFDLLTLRSGANVHTYPITVPEGCQNLSGVTRATLQIAFRDMVSAAVTTDRFQYRSLPEDRAVDILTQEMTVNIFGTAADVADLTGADFTVTADLGDYGAALGTYTVPAVIETTTGKDIGISGSYQVQVTIREPDTNTGEAPPEENTGETE